MSNKDIRSCVEGFDSEKYGKIISPYDFIYDFKNQVITIKYNDDMFNDADTLVEYEDGKIISKFEGRLQDFTILIKKHLTEEMESKKDG